MGAYNRRSGDNGMNIPQVSSSLTRPLLALLTVGTICACVLFQIQVPSWFLVFPPMIVGFYFGHVNGKSEEKTTQAGEIATAALTKSVQQGS